MAMLASETAASIAQKRCPCAGRSLSRSADSRMRLSRPKETLAASRHTSEISSVSTYPASAASTDKIAAVSPLATIEKPPEER